MTWEIFLCIRAVHKQKQYYSLLVTSCRISKEDLTISQMKFNDVENVKGNRMKEQDNKMKMFRLYFPLHQYSTIDPYDVLFIIFPCAS